MIGIFLVIIGICLVIISLYYHVSLHIKSRDFHKAWDKMTPKQHLQVLENLKEDDKAKFINIYYGRLWK